MSKVKSTVEYRDIQDFPGYRVGDDGSVWSCHLWGNNTGKLCDKWRRLKPRKVHGYLAVDLCTQGKKHSYLVHRLVLEAFIGPCQDGMECRHFPDCDPTNNRLENLQWGTNKKNAADRKVHGHTVQGEDFWSAKLTAKDIHEIRHRRATSGVSFPALGKEYGVSKFAIWAIINGKTWKHI